MGGGQVRGDGRQVVIHFIPFGKGIEAVKITHALGFDQGINRPGRDGSHPGLDFFPFRFDLRVADDIEVTGAARNISLSKISVKGFKAPS